LTSVFVNAMAKQAACAPVRSSSGLVRPSDSAVRARHEIGAPWTIPLVVSDTVPLPSVRVPFQDAVAMRSAIVSLLPIDVCGVFGAEFDRTRNGS
jgi:hypothetical protein